MLHARCLCWLRGSVCHSVGFASRFHTRGSRLFRQIPFLLADIGEGINEVQLLQWHVSPGDRIQQFDKIAEVQSDKAAVEITSRYDGTVKKLHYAVNDTAKVGMPLIDIETDDGGEEGGAIEPQSKAEPMQSSTACEASNRPAKGSAAGQPNALPRVRKLAQDHGVDLAGIVGSGAGGRITEDDVLGAAKGKATGASDKAAGFSELLLSPVKRAMARSMTASLQIPHFGYCDDYDWSAVETARKQQNSSALPLVLVVLSKALKEFPMLNAHFDAAQTRLMASSVHNIGVAMDTDHGLVVPVLKGIDSKSLPEIIEELNGLQKRAQSNSLRQADFEGATISISNIGSIGGVYASPVIVPPQVCIGVMGRARKLPVVEEGQDGFVPKLMAPFSWAADHRVVDGATLARFSNRLKLLLQDPSTFA